MNKVKINLIIINLCFTFIFSNIVNASTNIYIVTKVDNEIITNIDIEKETRWSMNCRFKSIFTPFGDKKIGEFFEPITLRKISELALKYKLPKINEKN